jgi:hypothetical protein
MRIESRDFKSVSLQSGGAPVRNERLHHESQGKGDTVKFSDLAQRLMRNSVDSGKAKLMAHPDDVTKDIMSRYDVTHIRYTELVEMADELRASGDLKDADYLDFIGPSPQFATIGNAQPDPAWNGPRNMIAHHLQQIEIQRSLGMEQRFIDFSEHLLQLFVGFQAYQQTSSPNGSGA